MEEYKGNVYCAVTKTGYFLVRTQDQATQHMIIGGFEARMRLRLPMDLYQEVRRRTQGKATPGTAFSKSIRFVTCAVLVDAYNKGLRTGSRNRLKLEWDMADDE